MKKYSLFLLVFTMVLSFFTVPAGAATIPGVDLATIDKGISIESYETPFIYFEMLTEYPWVNYLEAGNFISEVWYNSTTELYTYTYTMTPGVEFISTFNSADPISLFNGVAGWSFIEAAGVGGPGNATAFQITVDSTGIIQYAIVIDPIFWDDVSETITLFYQSYLPPSPTLGQFSIINAHSGAAVGLVPILEPDDPVECSLDHFLGYKIETTRACKGGVSLLTLQYNGSALARIEVTRRSGVVLFTGDVDAGANFAVGTSNETLGTEINIFVDGELSTTIHTSCSQPIFPDMVFGLFTVVGGESLEGGDLDESTAGFEPQVVTLTDPFETGKLFKVKKPYTLYNPAVKNDEEICDSDTHLVGYKIKRVKGQPKHKKRTILVENQFGVLSVDMKKPDRLLVPTAKNLGFPVEAPDNAAHNVDHYKCYNVKVTKRTDKFPKGIQVSVVDQFDQPKLYDVKKPSRLCIPVEKEVDGEVTEIKNPGAYLMYYKVKPAEGEPEHEKVLGIYTNNQFGPLKFDTKKEEDLGVPSEVAELAPGLFTCDKPIDELTMVWDGTQPIRVKPWKGKVGSTSLDEIDNIQPGHEITVSGLAGSPNDVYWEIFEAGTDNKIGESTFHLSCSDQDMNGPEDWGKQQGDGKEKSGFINDWTLEGMVDATGAFDSSTP